MTDIQIRPLGPADVQVFQRLRLRGLQDAPEAFGSTYEEDAAMPPAVVAERLTHTRTVPANVVFGAWQGAALVGFVGCFQQAKHKTRHTASVWGTYVAPEVRGTGIGRRLMDQLITEVRQWPDVARLTLSVVERAGPARRLYASVGFVEFGREPDAFRQDSVRDTALHLVLELDETRTQF
jgi:GNAT superfamily N-acetyltransferase